MSAERGAAQHIVYLTMIGQNNAVGGPPSYGGMAWAIVNALTAAGYDLADGSRSTNDRAAEVERLLDRIVGGDYGELCDHPADCACTAAQAIRLLGGDRARLRAAARHHDRDRAARRSGAVYVFQMVDPVSDNYHTEGGLVIATGRDPQAVWNEQNLSSSNYGEKVQPGTLPAPDAVYECMGLVGERVFVFPDSGCC